MHQVTTQSVLLETLKFPLLTIVHALNHWSTEKIIAFMDQYWWGNINKATKSAYLTCPTCPNTAQESLFIQLLDILNRLTDHSRFGKWISYNSLQLMDINMFKSRFVCFHTGTKSSRAGRQNKSRYTLQLSAPQNRQVRAWSLQVWSPLWSLCQCQTQIRLSVLPDLPMGN